jgi:hypothetical protein
MAIFLVVISLVLILGCTTEVQKKTEVNEVKTPPTGTMPPATPDTSEPDWSKKTIQVTGKCAVNPAHAGNPGQTKLMAERGAITDGRRLLLEQVLGVRIDSKTVVKDMVAQSDDLKAEVEGMVREAKPVGTYFDGSIASVNMELKLYTVYAYMKKQKIYYK